jgi:hypothetical protein
MTAVAELCGDPRSVTDVAALLSLPLAGPEFGWRMWDTRLVTGLVMVHRNRPGRERSGAETPDTVLMERVSSGLRRL